MTVLYTPDHEWIDIGDADAATVGITTHAQDALGDVVFVDLPAVGTHVQEGRGRRRRRVGQGRGRPLHAGQRRGRRGQRGAARRSVARQQRPARRRLVLQGPRQPTRPSSTQLMDQAAYDALVKNA